MGDFSDSAEVGVPGVLCLSQAASRAVAITTGAHTCPEQQGQGLLPSSIFSYTGEYKERALFPAPMKMMDSSILCANKGNHDCSLPR